MIFCHVHFYRSITLATGSEERTQYSVGARMSALLTAPNESYYQTICDELQGKVIATRSERINIL